MSCKRRLSHTFTLAEVFSILPNTIGKDIFVMSLRSNTSKLKIYGEGLPRDTLLNHSTWGWAVLAKEEQAIL